MRRNCMAWIIRRRWGDFLSFFRLYRNIDEFFNHPSCKNITDFYQNYQSVCHIMSTVKARYSPISVESSVKFWPSRSTVSTRLFRVLEYSVLDAALRISQTGLERGGLLVSFVCRFTVHRAELSLMDEDRQIGSESASTVDPAHHK